MPGAHPTRRTKAALRPREGARNAAEDRRGMTWGDYSAVRKPTAVPAAITQRRLKGRKDPELEPALPEVGPGMGHDIYAEVPAPCRQHSKENPQHTDDNDISPSLIGMKQPEDHALAQHGRRQT